MGTDEITKRVQALIVEGRLEDAAEEIMTFFDSTVLDKQEKDTFYLYNQVIHQISQLNELRNQQLAGLLDHETTTTKRGQIRQALLDINRKLRQLEGGRPYGAYVTDRKEPARKPRRRAWLWGMIVLALVAVVAIIALQPWDKPLTRAVPVERKPFPTAEQEVAQEATEAMGAEAEAQAAPAEEDASVQAQRAAPPAARETVTLTPDVQDMGRAGGGGVSGSLSSNSGQPFSPPSFGDRGRGVSVRAFLTFPLDDLPRDASVVEARLYCNKGGQSGNPSTFSTVIIEKVRIGSQLDEADYNASGSQVGRVRLSDLGDAIDLTSAVRAAVRAGERNLTLRFRTSPANNNDTERDAWAFRYSSGMTRLEVDYE